MYNPDNCFIIHTNIQTQRERGERISIWKSIKNVIGSFGLTMNCSFLYVNEVQSKKFEYSCISYKDLLVNDGLLIRKWFHKIIIELGS